MSTSVKVEGDNDVKLEDVSGEKSAAANTGVSGQEKVTEENADIKAEASA